MACVCVRVCVLSAPVVTSQRYTQCLCCTDASTLLWALVTATTGQRSDSDGGSYQPSAVDRLRDLEDALRDAHDQVWTVLPLLLQPALGSPVMTYAVCTCRGGGYGGASA